MPENSNTKKTLFICRSLDDYNKISSLISTTRGEIIVASDDLRVHWTIKKQNPKVQFTFLEKMESFYCVVDELLVILQMINSWLSKLEITDQDSQNLLYWASHCEGGDTTQRILDILLLKRSYLELLNKYNPNEIIVAKNAFITWEDELLCLLAKEIKISIQFSNGIEKLHSLFWKKWIGIRPFFVGMYRTIHVLLIKIKYLFQKRLLVDNKKFVAVQLPFSELKHHSHSITIAKSFSRLGYQGIILGWRLGRTISNIQKNEVEAIEVESWISIKDIITAWRNGIKIYLVARSKQDSFLANSSNSNFDSIRPILNQSMNSFIFTEFVERYLYSTGIKRLFSKHVPVAMRPLTIVLPFAVTAYNEAIKANPSLIAFMHGGWPYNVPNPITDSKQPIPRKDILYFSCGKKHRDILIKGGYNEKNVYATGLPWIESIVEFNKQYSKLESRKILNLKLDAKFYIVFDPNIPLRGYQANCEHYTVIRSLLEFASKHLNIEIVIKPHPSHIPGVLEEIIHEFSLPNVHIMDHSKLPYHALNSADVLITKISTLSIEAMFLDVPTVGITLDNEKNFMCYGDSVEYYNSNELMFQKISLLASDQLIRETWHKQMMKKRDEYFQEEGLKSSGEPAIEIANEVSSRLSQIQK